MDRHKFKSHKWKISYCVNDNNEINHRSFNKFNFITVWVLISICHTFIWVIKICVMPCISNNKFVNNTLLWLNNTCIDNITCEIESNTHTIILKSKQIYDDVERCMYFFSPKFSNYIVSFGSWLCIVLKKIILPSIHIKCSIYFIHLFNP